MPFDFFKKSKPDTKPEAPSEAVAEELSAAERAYLEQIERRLKEDTDASATAEAELRRREREELQKNYRPQKPLYHTGTHTTRTGEPQAVKGRPEEAQDKSQQKSYQNDPRYREYFERLRREGVDPRPTTNYDEEPKPQSLDELDRTGWSSPPKGTGSVSSSRSATGSTHPRPNASTASSSSSSSRSFSRTPTPTSSSLGRPQSQAAPASLDDLQPGALLRFDDGSVAIYKDAVSGKDYALFYFLDPSGGLEPRGIFMEQYERTKIGQLSPAVFAQMVERKRWERDALVFHLDQYDYAAFIPTPTGASSSAGSSSTATPSNWRTASQAGNAVNQTPVERRPPTNSDYSTSRSTSSSSSLRSSSSSRRDALLERGRVLRINVGGRVWESVYWTEDEIGPIVAHNTNKDWALMHLDLGRFKDSLEYGDVLSYEALSEIEQSLASQDKR